MRSKRRIITFIAAAALALTGLVSASTTARAAETGRLPLFTSNGHVVMADYDAVDGMGSRQFSSVYGGTVETNHGTGLRIYLTALSSRYTRALQAQSHGQTVTFARTSHSLAVMNTLAARLSSKSAVLRKEGVVIVTWAPDIYLGRIQVSVLHLTSKSRRILTAEFPPGTLDISSTSAFSVPTSSRDDDGSAWSGGDGIENGDNGCSDAFPVVYDGHQGMLTASHCELDISEGPWFNGISYSGGSDGSGTEVDGFLIRETGDGTGDTAIFKLYSGTASDQIWYGTIGNASKITVTGSNSNPVGSYVCNDGAYSGQVCGIKIASNNTCTTYSGFRQVCHLAYGSTANLGIANQKGDSGGPVIASDTSGGATALGVVSGAPGGSEVGCQHNATECFTGLYYTTINWVLTNWGQILKKG